MRRLEARLGVDIEARLRELYEVRRMTQPEIAAELGIDAATVSRWMAWFGIETRLFASEKAS